MNNTDRGIIKWQPFNSIVEEEKLIKKVIQEKNKIQKPYLSPEQILENENKIIEAFYEQLWIEIYYFENGFIKKTKSQINQLDAVFKKIYLRNQKILLFFQIIRIHML